MRGRGRGPGDPRTHPVELRLRVVREIVDEGSPPADVARVFGLAATTVNEWVRRYRGGGLDALVPKPIVPPVPRSRRGDPKHEAVKELREEHPEYGTRRISDLLKRFEALGVSEHEVRRILHEEGLIEAQKPAGPRQHPERRFERAAPNELWQSDIFTFLLRRHERLYLAAFMRRGRGVHSPGVRARRSGWRARCCTRTAPRCTGSCRTEPPGFGGKRRAAPPPRPRPSASPSSGRSRSGATCGANQ